jgi:hypothetical protein
MSRNDELVAVVTVAVSAKGVARALAERGATVYIAGRSQAGGIPQGPRGFTPHERSKRGPGVFCKQWAGCPGLRSPEECSIKGWQQE